MQAEVNIGIVGHVAHGKTSIVEKLAGIWTGKHSEEKKRGISIKLGYADTEIKKCSKCNIYTVNKNCPKCKSKAEFVRKVSFLDSPGHETLMFTVIAASSIMDGAVLVIAANETCPQPQTAEHLMILNMLGIKNVVIAQNKVDLVPVEQVKEHYKQIKNFVKGTVAENAPIIPIIANYGINIDSLIDAIEKTIPTPKRDKELPASMYIARSFDINKPGMSVLDIHGSVVGGSLMQGTLKIGDEIEIKPGIKKDEKSAYTPIIGKITNIMAGSENIDTAMPGGLIGIETDIDPSFAKADSLVGNLLGAPDTLPPILNEITINYSPFFRKDIDTSPLHMEESVVLGVGTATTFGFVTKKKKTSATIKLKREVCAVKGTRIAICRKQGMRWRLYGFGVIE